MCDILIRHTKVTGKLSSSGWVSAERSSTPTKFSILAQPPSPVLPPMPDLPKLIAAKSPMKARVVQRVSIYLFLDLVNFQIVRWRIRFYWIKNGKLTSMSMYCSQHRTRSRQVSSNNSVRARTKSVREQWEAVSVPMQWQTVHQPPWLRVQVRSKGTVNMAVDWFHVP